MRLPAMMCTPLLGPCPSELGLDHYDYHWASSHEGEQSLSGLALSAGIPHLFSHPAPHLACVSTCAVGLPASPPPASICHDFSSGRPTGVQAIAPGNSSDVAAAGGSNATLSAALGLEAAAGWAPFNHQRDGKALLGQLDLAFLGAYACGCGAGAAWIAVWVWAWSAAGSAVRLHVFGQWPRLPSNSWVVLASP